MTLDENYTERLVNAVAKTLVEALENLTITDVNMYRLGYTKAIDDFEKAMLDRLSKCIETFRLLDGLDIDEIAEQLKAGGK